MEALNAGADAIAAGSARVALVVVSDALRPGLGTGFEARCGAGAAAVVLAAEGGTASLGARVDAARRPLVDRYRGDGEIDNRDLYDARLFREEIFLPSIDAVVARRSRADDVGAWSLPDPDGRLGAVVAKKAGARPRRRPTSTTASATRGAAAALLGALGAIDARRRRSRSSAPAAAARPACSSTSKAPVPGAADGRGGARRRPARVVRRGAAGARPARTRRRDDPDGRAARERAVRARRRRDARPARRPLRRLRHDQHAAVDPPDLHQLRRTEARAGAARARRAPCTPT